MKALFFVAACLLNFGSMAQSAHAVKPDYKKIESATTGKTGKAAYDQLLKRYQHGDTNFKPEDLHLMYYGFLFQPSYSAYGRSDYADSVRELYKKDSMQTDDYRKVIYFENKVLHEYPFNIRDLNRLAGAFRKTGQMDSCNITRYKLHWVIETILATGDGQTEETAWHVISVDHEYDLLGVFGFSFGGQQSLTNKGCDYLTLAKNDEEVKGLYFDVNQILNAEMKLFKK